MSVVTIAYPDFSGVPNMRTDAQGRRIAQNLLPGQQAGTPLDEGLINPLILAIYDLTDSVNSGLVSGPEINSQIDQIRTDTTQKVDQVREELRSSSPPAVLYLTGTYDTPNDAFWAREQSRLLVSMERQQRQAQINQKEARLKQVAQLAEQRAQAAESQLNDLEKKADKIAAAIQKYTGVSL